MAKATFEAQYENIMEALFMMGEGLGATKEQLGRALWVSERTIDRIVAFIQKHYEIDGTVLNGQKHFSWNRQGLENALLRVAEAKGHSTPTGVFRNDYTGTNSPWRKA